LFLETGGANLKAMPRLRTAVAVLILLVLAVLGARMLPIYLDNMRLQSYVEGIAQNEEARTRPDDALRVAVLEKAAFLGLPVKAENVHILRSSETMRIDVRYIVRVDLPMYTVDLHFYPGAGSR
jgi:Domain of unknown function (DUF4845)